MIESVLDLETAVILAAVSLADGARMVPPQAIIVRRILTGPWKLVSEQGDRPKLRFVSWWSPLSSSVVLLAADRTAPAAASDLPSRSSSVAQHLEALRVTGAAALLTLVLGVPLAVRHLDVLGFTLVLAMLGMLAVVSSLILANGYRRLGHPARRALYALSPFTAPRAAELLLQSVIDGMSPLVVMRELLPPAHFARYLRPRVYDARVRQQLDIELESLVTPSEQATFLAAPAVSDAAMAYCPRCGGTWRTVDVECSECGVSVRPYTDPEKPQ